MEIDPRGIIVIGTSIDHYNYALPGVSQIQLYIITEYKLYQYSTGSVPNAAHTPAANQMVL